MNVMLLKINYLNVCRWVIAIPVNLEIVLIFTCLSSDLCIVRREER
jgi:hypothetical protein